MPATKAAKKDTVTKPNFFQKLKDATKPKGAGADRPGLWAKIGFTLSIVSAGTWLIPILGLGVSITALVFSILGLKVEKGRWFAVVGATLAIVFLNVTFIYGFYNVLLAMLQGGV